jgi:hypothetical protein
MECNHNAFMPMKMSLLTAWQQDFEQVQRVPLAHRQAGLSLATAYALITANDGEYAEKL